MISPELSAAIEVVGQLRGRWHDALTALRSASFNAGVDVVNGSASKPAVTAALYDAGRRAGLNSDLIMTTIVTGLHRASGGCESV